MEAGSEIGSGEGKPPRPDERLRRFTRRTFWIGLTIAAGSVLWAIAFPGECYGWTCEGTLVAFIGVPLGLFFLLEALVALLARLFLERRRRRRGESTP